MPLKKDPEGGSTNAYGSKNQIYCSSCFENREFSQPDISAAKMQVFVKNQLKKGVSEFFAGLFTTNIPKLERWKTLQKSI